MDITDCHSQCAHWLRNDKAANVKRGVFHMKHPPALRNVSHETNFFKFFRIIY